MRSGGMTALYRIAIDYAAGSRFGRSFNHGCEVAHVDVVALAA